MKKLIFLFLLLTAILQMTSAASACSGNGCDSNRHGGRGRGGRVRAGRAIWFPYLVGHGGVGLRRK